MMSTLCSFVEFSKNGNGLSKDHPMNSSISTLLKTFCIMQHIRIQSKIILGIDSNLLMNLTSVVKVHVFLINCEFI
jgi:hypothetical protein